MKHALSMLLCLFLFGWIGHYVWAHWSEFRELLRVSWYSAAGLAVFSFLYIGAQGLILRASVAPFGVNLKVREWYGVIVVTLLGNYIFPFAGLGFRAEYLRRSHDFSYTNFVSTLTAIQILEFVVFTVGGCLGLGYVYHRSGNLDPSLTVLFGLVLVGCAVVLLFSPRLKSSHKAVRKLTDLLESWYAVRKNHALIWRLTWLTLVEFLLYSMMFWFGYRAFGLGVGLVQSFVPACLSDYSLVIRLTPASFGLYEGSVVYSAKLVGVTVAQSLLVVGLLRVATILWIFTTGPIFSYVLMRSRT